MKRTRFVAIADVLGFREQLRHGLEALLERYEGLLRKARSATSLRIPKLYVDEPDNDDGEAKLRWASKPAPIPWAVFSDTLLLWSEEVRLDEVEPARWEAPLFFYSLVNLLAASIEVGLPLRIGVAYGDCFMDQSRNIYLGQPIVDAYRIEQTQAWIGGACHSSCESNLAFKSMFKGDRESRQVVVSSYPVPVKNREPNICGAINWPAALEDGKFNVAEWIHQQQHALDQSAPTSPERLKLHGYYQETLNFFNHVVTSK